VATLEALGRVGANPSELVPALGKLLDHESRKVRVEVLQALTKLGSEGLGYGKLLKAAGDADAEVAKLAAEVLKRKTPPTAAAEFDEVKEALKGNARACLAALDVLTRTGASAKGVVNDVVPLAEHTDQAVRLAALRTIEALDPDGPALIQLRVRALKDRDKVVRTRAALDLAGARGVDARVLKAQVIPLLIEAMRPETPQEDTRDDGPWKSPSQALARIDKTTLDPLMEALDANKGGLGDLAKANMRLRILKTIKALGSVPGSTKYQSKLLTVSKSDLFDPVRRAAEEARRAIQ
jgi:HEAT repeat protein